MSHIIFYEKPGCQGNARQQRILREAGYVLEVRDILTYPWTSATLRSFFGTQPVSAWFNPSAPAIKSGACQPDTMTENEALDAMLASPLLIRRPLMEIGTVKLTGFNVDALAAAGISLTHHPQFASLQQQALDACTHGASAPAQERQECR